MDPPILICGCPGSGASFVARILSHSGFFSGRDAGKVFQESQMLKRHNSELLNATIGITDPPTTVEQFQNHVRLVRENLEQLVSSIDKPKLLEAYWRNQYVSNSWGWKDPRNAANILVWREIFPELRLLIVDRTWKMRMMIQEGRSDAGNWFRRSSTAGLRRLYLRPPGSDQLDCHTVKFERLLCEPDELNSLLKWAGLPPTAAQHFKTYVRRIELEAEL